MERKTILGKIFGPVWDEIVDYFKSNYMRFMAKSYDKVPEEVKEKVTIGITIVQSIKKFVDSPIADLVTNVIPGQLDDKLKEFLRSFLPKVLARYEMLKGEEDYYQNIATAINTELTGSSRSQMLVTTEVVYKGLKAEGKI